MVGIVGNVCEGLAWGDGAVGVFVGLGTGLSRV
jgi:hypothetical protein